MTELQTRADIQVTPLTVNIGAEITGLDISQPLDDETTALVRNSLNQYHVLFFPEQNLDNDQHLAFARRFGTPTPAHPFYPSREEGHPNFHTPGSFAEDLDDKVRWGHWHADLTCLDRPPFASILRAADVPAVGGDTTWASMEAAYDRLDPELRDRIENLVAVHDGTPQFGRLLEEQGQGRWDGVPVTTLVTEHPVVVVHPETARKALYVNPGYTTHIVGIPRAESDALLRELFDHITRPEHAVRHHWKLGDIAFWDNRSVVHYAIRDYYRYPRRVLRITLSGHRPYGPAAT